jgi:hypothetical protein
VIGAPVRGLRPALAAMAQAFANDREGCFDHFAGFFFRRTDALVDQVHEIGFGHALWRIAPYPEGCCVDVRLAQSSVAVPARSNHEKKQRLSLSASRCCRICFSL